MIWLAKPVNTGSNVLSHIIKAYMALLHLNLSFSNIIKDYEKNNNLNPKVKTYRTSVSRFICSF